MNFAIVGATGNVGRKTIEILEKSKLKIDNLYLVASKKSAGKKPSVTRDGTQHVTVLQYSVLHASLKPVQ